MDQRILSVNIPEEYIRWFYKDHSSRRQNTQKPFRGFDSLNLERAYQAYEVDRSSKPKLTVRGNMFEVDLASRACNPIYWSGQKRSSQSHKAEWCATSVERGIWFNKLSWLPIEPALESVLEAEHTGLVIPKLLQLKENKKRRSYSKFKFWLGSYREY